MNNGNSNNSASGDKRTWPCSNCHATVSNEETRCPYCGGIQVKVKIPRSPLCTAKALNSNLLLERLATPTTPVTRKEVDAHRLQAFLSESATISTMDYDEEDDDEEDDDRVEEEQEDQRPASALSHASSLSQNFNIPDLPPPPFIATEERPPDPVALTLEAAQVSSGAPSPQVVFEKPQAMIAVPPKRKAASGFEVPKKKISLPH